MRNDLIFSKQEFAYLRSKLEEAIVADPAVRNSSLSVALTLAKHLNRKTFLAYPSNARIAKRTSYSDKQIRRSLAKLCGEDGWFIRRKRKGGGNTYVYFPRWARIDDLSPQMRSRLNRLWIYAAARFAHRETEVSATSVTQDRTNRSQMTDNLSKHLEKDPNTETQRDRVGALLRATADKKKVW